MNKNLTEIVYILDRSGSMSGLEKDTIGGYNSFLKKQKAEPGQAVVTTVLFDDKCEIIHDRVDIRKVAPLTNRQYYARGMTALLDAIGETVKRVSNRHKNAIPGEVPAKTIVVITTDGCENASMEYTYRMVADMVRVQKEKYGWEFLFLGANIDAIETAADFGITKERAVTYAADEVGTELNFASVCEVVSDMRASRPVTQSWKQKIEEHLKKTER
ncbi:MAG: vWA domain-containing protein [Eubacteriales bacterium]